jgi:hypothetical protein
MSDEQKKLLEAQLWAIANILRGKISANQFNIMTFLFVGQIFGIYPYSLTTSDSIIEYDDIWYHTIKVLCKRLTSSTHMQLDLQVFLHKINNLVDFSHLSYDDVTILFAIIDNRYFEDNSKYIRNMLKALLTKKYDKFDICHSLFYLSNISTIYLYVHYFYEIYTLNEKKEQDCIVFVPPIEFDCFFKLDSIEIARRKLNIANNFP